MKFSNFTKKPIEIDYWVSNPAEYQKLKLDPRIQEAESKLHWWFGDDEGWNHFMSSFDGAPHAVARNMAETMTKSFSEKHRKFVADDKTKESIYDGMWRAISAGWAIAVVEDLLKGWEPKRLLALDELLGSSAAKFAKIVRTSPRSDVEWYCFENRKGITVYQWMLRDIGISSDDLLTNPPATELMEIGRWLMLYGISMGRAQILIQSFGQSPSSPQTDP